MRFEPFVRFRLNGQSKIEHQLLYGKDRLNSGTGLRQRADRSFAKLNAQEVLPIFNSWFQQLAPYLTSAGTQQAPARGSVIADTQFAAETRGSLTMVKLLIYPFMRWARKLRPATLLKIAAALVCIDLVLPELIPFELLFGIGTLVLGNLSGRLFEGRSADVEPVADRSR